MALLFQAEGSVSGQEYVFFGIVCYQLLNHVGLHAHAEQGLRLLHECAFDGHKHSDGNSRGVFSGNAYERDSGSEQATVDEVVRGAYCLRSNAQHIIVGVPILDAHFGDRFPECGTLDNVGGRRMHNASRAEAAGNTASVSVLIHLRDWCCNVQLDIISIFMDWSGIGHSQYIGGHIRSIVAETLVGRRVQGPAFVSLHDSE